MKWHWRLRCINCGFVVARTKKKMESGKALMAKDFIMSKKYKKPPVDGDKMFCPRCESIEINYHEKVWNSGEQ